MVAIDKNAWTSTASSLRSSSLSRQLSDRLGCGWCNPPFRQLETRPQHTEDLKLPRAIHAGSRCVKGGYRETNEDRSYVDLRRGLFLVVDGVGGYSGGAQASQVLLDEVPRGFERPNADLKQVQQTFETVLAAARQKMAQMAKLKPDFRKMGATMAAGIVVRGVLYVAHVGDCRAYLARGESIRRLTCDQSLVQTLVEAGLLTEEQARQDPRRNIILNVVGPRLPDQALVVQASPLRAGDHLIFATDGLTGSVDDKSIAEIVHRHRCSQAIADDLVLTALRNGSRDNISCVVATVGAEGGLRETADNR